MTITSRRNVTCDRCKRQEDIERREGDIPKGWTKTTGDRHLCPDCIQARQVMMADFMANRRVAVEPA